MKVIINYKIDNNKIKLSIQYIAKNKSVYVKKDKKNFLKIFEEKESKKDEINKNIKDNININNDTDKYFVKRLKTGLIWF